MFARAQIILLKAKAPAVMQALLSRTLARVTSRRVSAESLLREVRWTLCGAGG